VETRQQRKFISAIVMLSYFFEGKKVQLFYLL
jgi:hypothetical protein